MTPALPLAFGAFALALGGATRSPAVEPLPGLPGVVYGDPAMTRPAGSLTMTRLDSDVAEWPTDNDWGLRLRGRLTTPVSGRVTLLVETSQRVRLWVAGRKILDVDGEGGSADVECRAGIPLPVILEYAQSARPSRLRVTWRLPGRPAEPIPAAALSHDQSDLAAIEATGVKPFRETLLEVANPDPARLASLRVWRAQNELLVRAAFPDVPGFACDSWCYEGGLEFVVCRDLGGGRLELRHRLTASPDVLVITEVAPEGGAVEFRARLEREDGKAGPLPESPIFPNLCWQLKNAPAFASRPDPYPAFISRCFIFTEKGRVFLDHTIRRKIPVQPADDPRNKPPWVQIYGPASEPPRRSPAGAWADYSADRFTWPVVGAVSRDGKYLAAIASGSAVSLCQAWHDCMHINSSWGPPEGRTWRLKIYAMENDPAKLLAAVAKDFPETRHQPAATAL